LPHGSSYAAGVGEQIAVFRILQKRILNILHLFIREHAAAAALEQGEVHELEERRFGS
jgi:hypothetical protein